MAFLAPIVAKAAPFLIGAFKNKGVQQAAAGIGSSILGSKLSGGGGGVPDARGLLDEQRQSIAKGREIAGGLEAPASNLLSLATRSYSPVADHFSRLLSGNRASTMEALSPEVQRINSGYQQTQQNASNLMPRGGGRSAFFSQLPFERNRDITNLLSTSRGRGAEGLLNTGNAAASTSRGLYATILDALNGGRSGASSLLNYDLQSKQDQYTKGKDVGRSIFDIISMIGGSGGNKPKLGGTGYPSYPDTGVYGPF